MFELSIENSNLNNTQDSDLGIDEIIELIKDTEKELLAVFMANLAESEDDREVFE